MKMMKNFLVSKIAKKIIAGGGAGIDFRISDTDGNISCVIQGTPENWRIIEKENTFEIVKFDALGYDDGMSDVSGTKVFKSIYVDNIFDDAKDYIENTVEYYSDNEQFLDDLQEGIKIKFNAVDNNSSITFAGWLRGTLKQNSDIEFNEDFEMYSDKWLMDNEVFNSSVIATLSKTGEEWWKDVFEWHPEDEYDDIYHQEELTELYGA